MQLKEGTLLQSGKYRINKILGQGGFGITYLAEQPGLRRKVAIKEFFMKEYCNRDEKTAFLTTPTSGFDVLVKKYKEKFVKEAQNIAQFKHDNIIKIYEVFEEKNTAYYVMEYHDGGTLAEYISKNGRMTGNIAQRYIREIAGALSYIHRQKVNHLDVKPSNIMLDSNNRAILIDFGISKHYDNSGNQTSSSPVGVSKGYAPLEQYKHGGVSSFSPETDIYSLGATLYNLITGCTPPEADDVNENGLVFPTNIRPSERIKRAITMAMQPRRRDRPKSVEMFLSILDNDIPEANTSIIEKTPHRSKAKVRVAITILAIMLGFGGYFAYTFVAYKKEKARIEAQKLAEEYKIDSLNYIKLISKGDSLLDIGKYSESINMYEQAQACENKYTDTEYIAKFNNEAYARLGVVNNAKMEEDRKTIYNRTHGCINGHDYVDLGLPSGLKWATCNVGANKPEVYGEYYAWGEICPNVTPSVTYGKDLGDIAGNSQYDVATAQWGINWRMPTVAEFQELIDKCTWEQVSRGGEDGYKVTGPNGNNIYLPSAGEYNNNNNYTYTYTACCLYWSSTPKDYDYAYVLECYRDHYSYNNNKYYKTISKNRNICYTIRPVSESNVIDTVMEQKLPITENYESLLVQSYSLDKKEDDFMFKLYMDFPIKGNAYLTDSIKKWIVESLIDDYDVDDLNNPDELLKKAYKESRTKYLDSEYESQLIMHYSKEFESENIVTYTKFIYYYGGGAHGSSFNSGVSFRTTDGQQIGWDMFATTDGLVDLIISGLKQQYFKVASDEDFFNEMMFDYNRSNFPLPEIHPWITSEGLVFQYGEYEITAYIQGKPYCVIPLSKIEHMLKKSVRELL